MDMDIVNEYFPAKTLAERLKPSEWTIPTGTTDFTDFTFRDTQGKINQSKIADWLVRRFQLKTMDSSGEIYKFDGRRYHNGAEPELRSFLQDNLPDEFSTTRFITEIVEAAKRISNTRSEDFNPSDTLLWCENGVLDWAEGQFAPAGPGIISTSYIPVSYDPTAECPLWEKFISEVVAPEDAITLQEFAGYCLWRTHKLHKALMLLGGGSNGKSVFINVIKEIIGRENVTGLSLQAISDGGFSLSNLYGKMLNCYADLDSSALKHTGQFKMATGGDQLYAEIKFGGFVSFTNYAKFMFSANELPATGDDTDAFFRRWFIVNFPRQFIGKDADPDLYEKLLAERSGILNWMLGGLARLHANGGFSDSRSTAEIRAQYIMKSSPLQAFIENECEITPEGMMDKDGFYEAFMSWAKAKNLPVQKFTKNKVGYDLPTFCESIRSERVSTPAGRARMWVGIRLKNISEEDPNS